MNDYVDIERFWGFQKLRDEIKARAKGKCERCGIKHGLGLIVPSGAARLYYVPIGAPSYDDPGRWRILCAECRGSQAEQSVESDVARGSQALLDFGGTE